MDVLFFLKNRTRLIRQYYELVGGYRSCLASCVGIDCSHCPADLALIEQVVLARNRDQHPENITTTRVSHAEKDQQQTL